MRSETSDKQITTIKRREGLLLSLRLCLDCPAFLSVAILSRRRREKCSKRPISGLICARKYVIVLQIIFDVCKYIKTAGRNKLESRDYERILNALPETGIYVVRQEDRAILYFNQRIRQFAPQIRLGAPCGELWGDSCSDCPLTKAAEEGRASVSVYSESVAKMMEITAVKTLWEGATPAFVITAIPNNDMQNAGNECSSEQKRRESQMASVLRARFKMMNTVHLDTGMCERISLGTGAQQDSVAVGDYSSYIERALNGYVHPDDVKSFRNALSLEHLREKAEQTQDYSEEVYIYRQRGEPVRWIELRVIYTRSEDGVVANILGQDVTREKSKEEFSNRALEERAYIIGSLSSLFFATYYVDLDRDSFRTVTQQRRVEDVLGDEVNCSAALEIYANHFIHPDDREEYLRVMNVENMVRQLRWWQPYLAVEYRKLSDEPDVGMGSWNWVRATVVLARSGTDDMPKTAVYVAQDIGGRRHDQDSGA